MGEGKNIEMFQDHQWFLYGGDHGMKNKIEDQRKKSMEEGKRSDGCGDDDDDHEMMRNNGCSPSSSSVTSSIGSDSSGSNGSTSSSLDTTDDASSSASSSNSSGALYDLSAIMAQLPIKRGLSQFYQGKSESFTSLSRVTSIEELAKKETPYNHRRRMKSCKSCEAGLDSFKLYTLPRPVISKKPSKVSSFSATFSCRRGSFISNGRPPVVPE